MDMYVGCGSVSSLFNSNVAVKLICARPVIKEDEYLYEMFIEIKMFIHLNFFGVFTYLGSLRVMNLSKDILFQNHIVDIINK